jgi:hypothetical protein
VFREFRTDYAAKRISITTKSKNMKNSIQKRKLTKHELREINGGARACAEGLCKLRGVHFLIVGPKGKDGYCC